MLTKPTTIELNPRNTVPVYSTSDVAIGSLDRNKLPDSFNLVDGPAIVVARKGYAGRLYVIEDAQFIVHEDAYPIRPKEDYEQHINLWWFAGHYSAEFQADRTSFWGIGDFPRVRFRNKVVMLPSRDFQDKVAQLYRRRSSLIVQIESSKDYFYSSVDSVVKASLESP